MTVMFTTVHDGQRHTRMSFSRSLVCDSPDWVRAIGSSGGVHDITTCMPCAVAKLIRDYRDPAAATAAEATFLEGSYAEQAKVQRNDYLSLSEAEYAFLTSRQAERTMRVAQFCPVRRIPSVLREMHACKALAMRQAEACPDVAAQCVLRSILYAQAAATLWERLRVETSDKVVLSRLRRQLALIG